MMQDPCLLRPPGLFNGNSYPFNAPYLARIGVFAAAVSALQASVKPDVAHEDPNALRCALTAVSTGGHARASGLVLLVLSGIFN